MGYILRTLSEVSTFTDATWPPALRKEMPQAVETAAELPIDPQSIVEQAFNDDFGQVDEAKVRRLGEVIIEPFNQTDPSLDS